MARNLTASDRHRLIKLASTMPVGSPERKAILAGLSTRPKEAGLMESVSRGDFKKDALALLPRVDAEIADAMKAFAKEQVASWDHFIPDSDGRPEDFEAWFDELDMAVDAIKAWKRNLQKALK
jgi:hypothetical protein